jgi:hypothetical protein
MARLWISGAVMLFMGVALSASQGQTPAPRPDLSGQWNSESTASVGPGTSSWGSTIQIRQTDDGITVQPASGKAQQYKLDGSETAEVISVNGCVNRTRITKAAASRDTVTITTWMVVKSSCVHGEVDDEPLVSGPGPIEVREVRGRRKLESITLLSRQGSALTVDSTRSGPDGPVSASTTYRK